MKVVALQSNYIPWKGYFDLIKNCDVFCFYDEVQYTKNDWRNRNQILGPNGTFWLTIPIAAKAVSLKISEVNIGDSRWQKKHFKSIAQSYSAAPFREEVLGFLEPYYLSKSWNNLSEFNQTLIKDISLKLGLTTKFANSGDFNLQDSKIDRLLNLLLDLKCTTYISGPSGKNYLEQNETLFNERGIEIEYFSYGPYPDYKSDKNTGQHHHLSILELLFNTGFSHAKSYF